MLRSLFLLGSLLCVIVAVAAFILSVNVLLLAAIR